MHQLRVAARPLAVLGGLLLAFAVVAPVAAHEERDVNGYQFAVGFIDEPVYVGDKSGLEFFVNKDNQPVADLEKTITAQVTYGSAAPRDLPITADDDVAGRYFSSFIPTAAGKYSFHLKGTLPDGSSLDQTFTSSPTGFNEVQEVAGCQYPVQFPSQAELAAQAKQGADAASQVTIAIGLGAVGVILGLVALGVAVASRSKTR